MPLKYNPLKPLPIEYGSFYWEDYPFDKVIFTAQISRRDARFIAHCKELDVDGSGSDPDKAIGDLIFGIDRLLEAYHHLGLLQEHLQRLNLVG